MALYISTVTGASFFVDTGTDLSGKHSNGEGIIVTDSAGKTAYGIISATAPAGETLAANMLVNGNMETGDPPASWPSTSSTLDGVADERTGGAGIQSLDILATAVYGRVLQAAGAAATVGALYKCSVWNKNVSGGHGSMRLSFSPSTFQEKDYNNALWTQKVGYLTADNVTWALYLYGCTDIYVVGDEQRYDDASLNRVTDCAATGVLVEAWTVDAGFNPNSLSSYSIISSASLISVPIFTIFNKWLWR